MVHRRCESRPGTVGRAVMGVEEGFGGASLLGALKVQGRPLDVALWTLEMLKGSGRAVMCLSLALGR